MQVDQTTLWRAYIKISEMNPLLRSRQQFHQYFGITNKQWAKFKQTGKLKVSQVTFMKLKHATLLDSPYHAALTKIIEVRYKK